MAGAAQHTLNGREVRLLEFDVQTAWKSSVVDREDAKRLPWPGHERVPHATWGVAVTFVDVAGMQLAVLARPEDAEEKLRQALEDEPE